jgi:enterochelin esterase-like enzyme
MRLIRRATLAVFAMAAAMGIALYAQTPPPASAPGTPAGQAPASQGPAAPAAGRGAGRGAAPLKSPEVGADRRVTFRLRAPNAKEVAVTISGKRLDMTKDDQGVWSVTADPLAPDIYTYSMTVDGATINDPSNRQFQTSFGTFQTMFVVPGPMAWLPAPGVPRGAIARHAFHSNIANDDRDFFVYTPPGYDARRPQPYPVLYILHGLGDDAERWVGAGAAHVILDNLIASGKAVPMVMVSPLGYGTSQGPAGGRGHENILGYNRILLDEVMPTVDRAYNVSKDRTQRAIAGLSMGGAEALYVGLNNLDKFAWISSFSGAFLLLPGTQMVPVAQAAASPAEAASGRGSGRGGAQQMLDPGTFAKAFPKLDAKANSQIRLLWIVCGTADGLIGQNRQVKEWLKSKGVQFTEQEVPDMGHVWPLWRQNLADLAPRLFQKGK